MRRVSVAVLLLSVLSVGCKTNQPETGQLLTPTLPPTEANPGWRQLPTAPLEGRGWHSTTWTGEELIIWGGVHLPPGTVQDDGALFEIASDEWRLLPASPMEGRVGHTAVWTGEELILWGGHSGGVGMHPTTRFSDGAAYRPGDDSWRPITTPELTGGPGYASVWTGSEMILVGGNDGYLSAAVKGLNEAGAYDPATDRWRILEMPIDLLELDAVWTGTEVVIYGAERYLGPLVGISFEPISGTWRELPPAPIDPAMPDIDLVGDHILAWTYFPETDGIAALDLLTLQWRQLPPLPGRSSDGPPTAAAMGPAEVMMQSESVMAIYSEDTNEWRTIDPPSSKMANIWPLPFSAWTGTEALFFRSGVPSGDPNAPSGIPFLFWSYTP